MIQKPLPHTIRYEEYSINAYFLLILENKNDVVMKADDSTKAGPILESDPSKYDLLEYILWWL